MVGYNLLPGQKMLEVNLEEEQQSWRYIFWISHWTCQPISSVCNAHHLNYEKGQDFTHGEKKNKQYK